MHSIVGAQNCPNSLIEELEIASFYVVFHRGFENFDSQIYSHFCVDSVIELDRSPAQRCGVNDGIESIDFK